MTGKFNTLNYDRESYLSALYSNSNTGVIPKIPLEDREPIRERNQRHYYRIALNYSMTKARFGWKCGNMNCLIPIPSHSYYWKYKGSRAYWSMNRYSVWDRVCVDCYVDHILDPQSERFRIFMTDRLQREANRLEQSIHEYTSNKDAMSTPRRR